jgi:hypothetical protein
VTNGDAPFHIVLTTTAIQLIAWPGADWQDLQAHFTDFVTSFGPMDEDEARDLLEAEWPDLARNRAAAISSFFAGHCARLQL